MFQAQESNFWHHTTLIEAMAFRDINSYKDGLRPEQMLYILGENELNTRLLLAHLVEDKILVFEGNRYFLSKEAFDHGVRALTNIRMDQVKKYMKNEFADERERNGVSHVLYDFLSVVKKINDLKEKPEPRENASRQVPKEVGVKNLPPALKSDKARGAKRDGGKQEKYSHPLTLENLALERLSEWYNKNNRPEHEIMQFNDVFSRLCTVFSLTKDQAWSLLVSMEKQKLIEIVPYHGIRLLKNHDIKRNRVSE